MLQASVPNVSSAFSDICCKCAYLDDAYVSHICCKSMYEMFQLCQSYVAISVFMLQVASVLFGCCICFTHMLQVYVPNVSSASDLCSLQVFHVASVSCLRGLFREGALPGCQGKGRVKGRDGGLEEDE